MGVLNLNNYYFIKCFREKQHMLDFNFGTNIYLNSLEYYHEQKDEFVSDFEGGIFMQKDFHGHIIGTTEELTGEQVIEKYEKHQFADNQIFAEVTSLKMNLCGYICCFAMFEKSRIEFGSQIIFSDKDCTVQADFYKFLNSYAEDQYAFVSVYDAATMLSTMTKGLQEQGYRFNYAPVEYRHLTDDDRIHLYNDKEWHRLVFSKDMSFAYQNEFRVYIPAKNKDSNADHIEIKGIDLSSSKVIDFAYLSPAYAAEHGIFSSKSNAQ